MFVELPEKVGLKEQFSIVKEQLGIKKGKVYFYRIFDDFVIAFTGEGKDEIRIGRLIRKLSERLEKFAVIGESGDKLHLFYKKGNERRFYLVDNEEVAVRVFLKELEPGTEVYVYGRDSLKASVKRAIESAGKELTFKAVSVEPEKEDYDRVFEEKSLLEALREKLGRFSEKRVPVEKKVLVRIGLWVGIFLVALVIIEFWGRKREEASVKVREIAKKDTKVKMKKNRFAWRAIEQNLPALFYAEYDGKVLSLVGKGIEGTEKLGEFSVKRVGVVPLEEDFKEVSSPPWEDFGEFEKLSGYSGACRYALYELKRKEVLLLEPFFRLNKTLKFSASCAGRECFVKVEVCS